MYERPRSSRSIALATLAAALAWSLPALAVEADSETAGAPSDELANAAIYHTLEPGETLSEIAQRYGSSVAILIREHEIADTRKVRAGTRLRIPAPGRRSSALAGETKPGADDSDANEIAALLDRCESELRAARFEQAVASAAEARDRIDARVAARDDSTSRVRLEIASATAYVALGQNDAALESLERALAADPQLELDPVLTSPKVLAVFRAARGLAARPR